MNLRSVFSSLILVLASPVFAQTPTTYKIKQVIASQNLVVAETSNPDEVITAGKIFLVTFANEKQCSLSLKEKNGALLTLSSSECSNAQDITRSLPLEPSLASASVEAPVYKTEPATAVETYPRGDRWTATRFSMAAHYSGATDLKFNDISVSTASGSGTGQVEFGLESSVGIGVSFASMHPNGWGYLTNIFYERSRDFKSATIKGSSGTTTVTSGGGSSAINFIVAEMNAVYRWNTFYMPFGLNVSAPTISDASSLTYYGGIGVFWGGGFILNENMSMEIFMRSLGMSMKQYTTTATIDYGVGTLTGIGAGLKFWF